MNPQRSFLRKLVYLVAIALLLVPLFWLGQPATVDLKESKGTPGGKLAQLRDQHHLSQAYLGEIDPTGETIKLATLGMRGIAANILWEKANLYKMKKDWTNLSATLKQITKLEPNFIAVWRFQAWNLAYNVSVEFDDYRQRYRWVIKGIEFLKEGIKYNEREPILPWDVGWFTAQKIGRADEHKQFRRLFKEDDDFHGSRPLAQRDNWLVGREWFLAAEEMVDTLGVRMKGNTPLIYRSDAPMCLMNYAEALETDGVFGEVAKRAWISAAADWDRYGSRDFLTSRGQTIRLGEKEMHVENARKLHAELEALQPGLREKIFEEKLAKLTPEQRKALELPPLSRTPQQQEAAQEAEKRLQVTHAEVARRVVPENRKHAADLAEQLAQAEQLATLIQHEREVVNFEYWRTHAQVEQADDTIAARQSIYQGDRAYADGDLVAARKAYDQGLAAWRRVLDKFPQLISYKATGHDLDDVINRYALILDQLDERFPKDFILQDVIDANRNPDTQ